MSGNGGPFSGTPQQPRSVEVCADNLFKQWIRDGKVLVQEMGVIYDDARRYCATVLNMPDGGDDEETK